MWWQQKVFAVCVCVCVRACVNVGSFSNECVSPVVSTQAHTNTVSSFDCFPPFSLSFRVLAYVVVLVRSLSLSPTVILLLQPRLCLFFLCCLSLLSFLTLSVFSIPCHLCCVSVSGVRYAFLPLFLFNACHCKIYGNFVWCFYWICLKNSIPMLLYVYLNLCCCCCCCCCRPCCRFCCFSRALTMTFPSAFFPFLFFVLFCFRSNAIQNFFHKFKEWQKPDRHTHISIIQRNT